MARLQANATDALRALAAARTPDDGAGERAWPLMQQRIVDGPPPIAIDDPRPTVVGRTRWIATGIAIAAVVVAAVGLGNWSAGWLASVDAQPPAEAPYSTTPQDVSREDTATTREPDPTRSIEAEDALPIQPVGAAVIDEDQRETVTVAQPKPRVRSSEAPRRAEREPAPTLPAAKTTTLAEEMRLLARANAAMRAGNPSAALAVLDEHARDYASGQLAPEREYNRALALCKLGRTDTARSVADAFVRAHPRSALRAKAESVCRE